MRKAVFPVFCLLAIGWSSAQAAPPVKPSRSSAGTLCKASETALFDCAASDAVSSICRNGERVIFRYGYSWERAELEVASNGHDGRAHQYFARMGSNPNGIGEVADQRRVRFSWRGVDFIAFVTDWGNRRFDSGLAIEKDNVSLSYFRCKITRQSDFSAPSFVEEEKESQHKGVY
jgi:hypothetical protein